MIVDTEGSETPAASIIIRNDWIIFTKVSEINKSNRSQECDSCDEIEYP